MGRLALPLFIDAVKQRSGVDETLATFLGCSEWAEARIAAMKAEDVNRMLDGNALFQHAKKRKGAADVS